VARFGGLLLAGMRGGEVIELLQGDWRTALAHVEMVDHVIVDPPYGTRAHAGHDDGTEQVLSVTGQKTRRSIDYWFWTPDDVAEFIGSWAPRTRGWMACMTSHDLIPAYEKAYAAADRYHFAPVPIFQKRPRLLGDGPANWTVYLMVSRPKSIAYSRWGCLPGHYESSCERDAIVVGAKPLKLMREIVADYSHEGDLIADPCAGGATTLLAAKLLGRRAIGAELDPKTHALAVDRLSDIPLPTHQQSTLFQAMEDA
jgi:site-specific DNA-methyltransferase (adenine-specific)